MQQQKIEIFVATTGDDNGTGTAEQPLATVEAACKKARSLNQAMQSDIYITIRQGAYYLEAPLELQGDLDSGRNGHRIIYQAYGYGTDEQEEVVLSGGQEIAGWQLYDKVKNIWTAGIGDVHTRQLFVEGKRATRASASLSAELVKTANGYHLSGQQAMQWGSPGDLEFVYTGIYPWSEARIGVDTIQADQDGSAIIMKQPAFDWATKLYKHKSKVSDKEKVAGMEEAAGLAAIYGLERPSAIENGLGFLEQPGTFVFDSSKSGAHKIYYIPRPDEKMPHVKAVVPVLETLVRGAGTENMPLRNIAFQGLTFAHTTWLQPSGPNGFLHYHGATYYKGGSLQEVEWAEGSTVIVPGESELTPSALVFEQARGIVFADNHFTHLGAGGLEFAVGCSFNSITGNIFEDISATAIIIGNTIGPLALRKDTKANRIENNWVHGSGNEYHGSSAILIMDAPDTTVSHNQVNDVPHSGIVIYGGDATRRLKVLNNLVFNSMQVLADGAGINLANAQGTSYEDGGVVSGNVIRDAITSYNFGLYTDYGTAWLTVEGNIIYRCDTVITPEVLPPLQYVTFKENFWDKEPKDGGKIPDTVVISDNTLLDSSDVEGAIAKNPAAHHIFTTAGIDQNRRLHKVRN